MSMNTDNLITTIYTEDAKGNAALFGKPIEEQRKEMLIYDKMLKTFKTIVKDINDSNNRLQVHCSFLEVFDSFSNEIKVFLEKVDNDEVYFFASFLKILRYCENFIEQSLDQSLEEEATMFAPLFRDYEKQVKELGDSFIQLLQDYGPKVDLDPVNYEVIITLLRDGKEKHIEVSEWFVQITRCKDEDRKKFKIDEPPADDGFTYFIFVSTPGFETIWVSKEEAVAIKKRLYQAQKAARIYDD